MLKRFLSALTGLVLVLSIPITSLAVERYEVLQVGDEDTWVMELQEKLNELGYLEVPATGYYGTNTQNAVVRFQQDHGLTADGKAGPATRKAVFGDEYEPITGPRTPGLDESVIGKPTGPSTSDGELTGPTASPAPSPSAPSAGAEENVLKLGDRGDAVSDLQTKLASFGYYTYGSVTGYFGPVTEEAVKKFQAAYNLEQTGIVGSAEMAILNSQQVEAYSYRQGDSGEEVRKLQQRLIDLGYMNSSATGYFGRVTKQAVIDFQKAHGLAADGVAKASVLDLLYSDAAKPADGAVPAPTATAQPTQAPTQAPADPTQAPEQPTASPSEQPEPTQSPVDPSEPPADPTEEPTDVPDDFDLPTETPLDPDAEYTVTPPDPSGPIDIPEEPSEDEPVDSSVEGMMAVADAQVGKSYVYGAAGPNSFDCSGFVYYVLKNAGVSVTRQSSASYAVNTAWESVKDKASLKIGDLLFFKSDSSKAISHVGIYVGGGNFIHSAPSIGGVGYSTMSSGYYARNYVSARRVF